MAKALPRTIEQHVVAAAHALAQAKVTLGHGTATPIDEAAFLVGEALGIAPAHLAAHWHRRTDGKAIAELVATRIRTRTPAPYLTKSAYIQGIKFYVDERALVPRSFIGELLFAPHIVGATAFIPTPGRIKRVLDLCTGSGCLAILAAKVFRQAKVDAVDLSPDALEVAKINVRRHRLGRRVTLYGGDLFAALPRRTYDLIICNPPYVAPASMRRLPAEYRREPALALAGGGRDGMNLVARILAETPKWLTPTGALMCEIGAGRRALERRFPGLNFMWLDTAESSGEVFWLTASDFPLPMNSR